jgi:putative Ca2+/H+ antiporter (TMEM165/GDT1 family)
MTPFQYVLIGLVVGHLVCALLAIIKVIKTIQLSKKQKIWNVIGVIFVPFLWALLIFYMFKEELPSYEIEEKNDVSSNNFYESRKGFIR